MKALNSFFDFTIKIDNYLYGKKMTIFLLSSFIIVVLFNIFDILKKNSSPYDIIFMLLYFLFILNTFFAWIGSWRNDEGNWTLQRFSSQIRMYLKLFKDLQIQHKNRGKFEYLYFLGVFLFFFGICAKSIVLLTKYLAYLSSGIISISFDKYITFFSISLILGFVILVYIGFYHKELLNIKKLLGWSKDKNSLVKQVKLDHDYIVDTKNPVHVESLIKLNRSSYFHDFVNVLSNWKPRQYDEEWRYQVALEYQFRLHLPDSQIGHQKSFNNMEGFKKRPDMILNDNILIEMKARNVGSEFDRVQGQLNNYLRLWNEKGPVVLIINNVDYETAKKRLTPYFLEQRQLNKNIIAFVV